MPTSEDLAYAAGLIDGEGCICIQKSSYGTKSNLPPNYALIVVVSTTDAILTPWLHARFGGSVCKFRGYAPLRGLKQVGMSSRWMVASAEAEQFLRAVLPYLQLKKQRAEVALRFRGLISRTGRPIAEENRALRRGCYEEMRALNQRGIWEKVA